MTRIDSMRRMVMDLGWALYPAHSFRRSGMHKGGCTCWRPFECRRPGAHSRHGDGIDGATRDMAVLTEWFKRNPNSNLGVHAGRSRLVGIEFYNRNGGQAAVDHLTGIHGGEWKEGVSFRSDDGGAHLLFRAPEAMEIEWFRRWGKGVCIRAGAQGIIVPPSRDAEGQAYEWKKDRDPFDRDLPDLPDWLIDAVLGWGNSA